MKHKTTRLAESIRNQHVAISVAAGLARAQLVPNPVGVYDARHLSDMLDVIADAIARVAPIYSLNARTGEAQSLTADELDGATFTRGASTLVLKDGTRIASVSITRGDLRHAVAVLKTIGFPAEPQAEKPRAELVAPGTIAALLAEIGQLLHLPLTPACVDKVSRLVMDIVRAARSGPVANQAMRLISALHHARVIGEARSGVVDAALASLHQAAEKAKA